ncbi:MAG TPA: translation initiation factor IF-2 N-terminal domain-containing protein [Pseudonocardiaceae bacterium]|jgi:ribonuclease E|nr:translation initiation factor IF-2 N-terminal domain-containing protein [Pseudonocardiaceae bacterium]
MSNTSDPAASGGDFGAPALTDLPAKVRVHALAKLLDRSSRDVLDALSSLGESARSAQSSLDRDVAIKVAEVLLGDGAAAPAEQAATESEPESEPEPAADVRPPALTPVFAAPSPVFLPPSPAPVARPKPVEQPVADEPEPADEVTEEQADVDTDSGDDDDAGNRRRRRRGRRGRGRGKGGQNDAADDGDEVQTETAAEDGDTGSDEGDDQDEAAAGEDEDSGGTRRRRRRRRRKGSADDAATEDDPPNTVVHVRDGRDEKQTERHEQSSGQDEVRSVRGSTRLEAKRQRRRDGREAGRRRVPILSESEFLARREAVDRKMVVNQRGDSVQIGVLEDGVLVEHFVTSAGSGSLVGNVYLGRVQNVLPSMEAAFVDIGRGRNAVLYAGEVDWDAAGLEGKARKIEQALSTGDSVLVQVTKDPVGHKGARLTTQISLPGRFLVYVPGGGATGISRKLPDTERKRLKDVLKRVVPEDAGVIIRTASEGVSEEELGRDVRRLRAQWDVIKENAGKPNAKAPQLLYEEPDLLIKVVRDLFTEDFSALTVSGDDAWDTIEAYVTHVAPDLVDRLKRHVGNNDVFTEFRIDEQILKALDRKVWLPSGGYLVIDRTEAMTVIDVNTGKFTGSGGNLEETVTRNNLEAAEEIVRQLRLRDIGGIIVVDFIDMVLESNRDLVLRRLTECLGRDRTRHQVAEVTSLGLVQMTRKRVGTGLLEAFSTTCEHCRGRGIIVSTTPVHAHPTPTGGGSSHGNGNGNGNNGQQQGGGGRRNRYRHGDQEAAKQAAPVEEPATEKPAEKPAPEPVAEKPAVAQPAVEQPAQQPVAEQPAVEQPAAQVEPAVEAEPVVDAEVVVEAAPVVDVAEPAADSVVVVEQVPEPVADQVPADVEPATEVVAEVAESAEAQADGAAEESGGEPGEDDEPDVTSTNGHQQAAVPTPAVAVANPPRPTRRRVASRPAGPPAGQGGQWGDQTPV